ncbi:threonylcarbamoyl-AMP synthase [Alginatibacterium sediminis]|uniref:Threonylcarbamoyl-AMP synthase n=1 Tax=Alginatibacterium sediminis TaxID=2164068 RepID=A0A420EI98_9ALTE|nr:L-threonylcarbamoyladenylate synthase [Alginatibacterium sediminis]RKF20398.1 threonylcarbamoyl-AMP synthase [Alginatibacterium sediminis]
MSQFFYIHPDTPQQRLLKQSVAIIEKGGVIVYPTDSGYALGCAIGNKSAMDKIIQIRQLGKDHNFTLMCKDLTELSVFARVENNAFRLIRNHSPGPYTFILKGTKEVPKRLLNPKRKTIGLRVPDNRIALALLEELGAPLMSVSLIFPDDDTAESDPELIRDRLERQVDLIINGGILPEQLTSIIDFSEGDVNILRHGIGNTEAFE